MTTPLLRSSNMFLLKRLFVSVVLVVFLAGYVAGDSYNIGLGRGDVTGPAAEVLYEILKGNIHDFFFISFRMGLRILNV